MTTPDIRPMLDVKNVTKQFGNLVAVGNVSMQVAAGELRAIIGPNGAGKTTFFNMISGFFAPTAGEIVFDGPPRALEDSHLLEIYGGEGWLE